MLFSSNVFLFLFLPCALLGYQILGRFGRIPVFTWLSLASVVFYGYWNPKFLVLLVLSILFNFMTARLITRATEERARSLLLAAGIGVNLAVLFWYKYLFAVLHVFPFASSLPSWFTATVLPLGISFFTFTQTAYLVDLRQGAAEPQSLLSYTLFVTFFPHLIAGPILHHKDMMPQFNADRRRGLMSSDLSVGLTWFLLGLSKKVLIADRFSIVADSFFASPREFGTQASWAGALAYAIQLYFDFSGYSDMAIGLARMFSIVFPMNFNSPYKAENINEFWQRWHMTLTHYILSYVYAPIQMKVSRWRQDHGLKVSRKAQATLGGFGQMVALPTLCTMGLAGVWHGAGLQFVFYGLVHGVMITIYHLWRLLLPETSWPRRLLTQPVSIVLTFVAVVFSFVLFRSPSLRDACAVYGGLLGRNHIPGGLSLYTKMPQSASLLTLSRAQFWPEAVLILWIVWFLPNTQQIMGQVHASEQKLSALWGYLRWKPNFAWALLLMSLTGITLLLVHNSTSFLYFQF